MRHIRETGEGLPLSDEPSGEEPKPAPDSSFKPGSEKSGKAFDFQPQNISEAGQLRRARQYAENLRHILGESASPEEVSNIIRLSMAERNRALQLYGELFLVPGRIEKVSRETNVIGRENLENVLVEKGRGVITTPHLVYSGVDWKLLQHWLDRKAAGTSLFQNFNVNRLLAGRQNIGSSLDVHLRGRRPWRTVIHNPEDPRALLGLVHKLKKGTPDNPELFSTAGDRGDLAPPKKRIPVRFFDATVEFAGGPAALSRLADAPMLPVAITHDNSGFTLEFAPPIEVDGQLPNDEADQKATQQFASFVERIVRQHPDQWFMSRPDYWPKQ